MKKVLLTSAAVLAVAALAVPVFAQGEDANNSNALTQKTYSSWRDAAVEANRQVEAHAAEIAAEAQRQPEVVSAAQALAAAKEIVGHTHEAEVAKAQAAYDAALADATNTVRNRYIQVLQENYNNAAKAEGRYYNENGVEANRTNEQRIADDQAAQGKTPAAKPEVAPSEEQKAMTMKDAEKAKAAESKTKAAAKADAKKELPKTHAVK